MLSKIFIFKRDIRNVITVSQSLQSIFKGMFPNAILYDYQHGLISLKYNGYLNGNSVANHIIINKSNVLLHGKAIKNKLLNLKRGLIFQKTFLCSRILILKNIINLKQALTETYCLHYSLQIVIPVN